MLGSMMWQSKLTNTAVAHGEWVNEYRLLHTLGEGSYGKVKLCERNVGSPPYKQFAVKILNKRKLMKDKRYRNTRNGMVALTALDGVYKSIELTRLVCHINVELLYEIIDDHSQDKIWLIMEFLPGGQLMDLDEDTMTFHSTGGGGVIEEELARRYFLDLLDGLRYLHRRGIVHRDIKPENIMVSRKGRAVLVDLGGSLRLPLTEAAAAAEFAEASDEAEAAAAAENVIDPATPPPNGMPPTPPNAQMGPGRPLVEDVREEELPLDEVREEGRPLVEVREREGETEEAALARYFRSHSCETAGTIAFFAPEMLHGTEGGEGGGDSEVEEGFCMRRADVWALGCTLYAMLVGRPPFSTTPLHPSSALGSDSNSAAVEPGVAAAAADGDDGGDDGGGGGGGEGGGVLELFRQIDEEEPEIPEDKLSGPVCALLRALLHKDPAKRPDLERISQFEWLAQERE